MIANEDKLLNLFEQLLQVSRQMFDITQNNDEKEEWVVELTQLIEKRGDLIQEIDGIKGNADADYILNTEKGLAVENIIKEIQETDAKVSKHLKGKMQFMRGKIGDIRQIKKAQHAYLGNEDQEDGWFFDSRK